MAARRVIWSAMLAVVALAAACTSAPVPVEFPDGPGDVVVPAAPDPVGPISFRGRELVDGAGRVVQIHGTNMVQKVAPSFVEVDGPILNETNLAQLRRDGMNGVRLGVRADALMPQPGVIDQQYLDRVMEGLDLLGSRGFWVLVDIHQDVFDGMPAWATTPEAAALPVIPEDLAQGAAWALQYLSPRSLRQWEDWWGQVPVAQGRSAADLYGDGLVEIAQRVADRDHVIGIDLMNEPFPGNRFFDCLSGGCASRYAQVEAVMSSWTDRVRAAAPDLEVWWAPFNFGPPFQGTPAPGPGVGYTFHSYCLGTDGGSAEQPDAVSNTLCQAVYDTTVADAQRIGRTWDAPVLLGEFGASASPLNSTRLTELADQHMMSWLHWHCCGGSEVVRTNLVRAYAQATAGTPLFQQYTPASGEFRFRFRPDPTIDAPTVIAVPSDPYPWGYRVEVVGGVVTSPPQSGRLTIEASAGADEVEVRVERVGASG
jgi:endoglycosylceramidase